MADDFLSSSSSHELRNSMHPSNSTGVNHVNLFANVLMFLILLEWYKSDIVDVELDSVAIVFRRSEEPGAKATCRRLDEFLSTVIVHSTCITLAHMILELGHRHYNGNPGFGTHFLVILCPRSPDRPRIQVVAPDLLVITCMVGS